MSRRPFCLHHGEFAVHLPSCHIWHCSRRPTDCQDQHFQNTWAVAMEERNQESPIPGMEFYSWRLGPNPRWPFLKNTCKSSGQLTQWLQLHSNSFSNIPTPGTPLHSTLSACWGSHTSGTVSLSGVEKCGHSSRWTLSSWRGGLLGHIMAFIKP